MLDYPAITRIVWYLLVAGEVAVCSAIICRRTYREYPGFSSFMAAALFGSVFLIVAPGLPNGDYLYWYGYWVITAIRDVIMVWALWSLAGKVFKPYNTLPLRVRRNAVLTLVGIGVLCVTLAIINPLRHPNQVLAGVRALDRSASLFLCGGIVLVALLSRYLGIPWLRRSYWLGSGMVLYLSVDAAIEMLAAPRSAHDASLIYTVSMIGFLVAEIVWFIAIVRRDTELFVPTEEDMQRVREHMEYLKAQLQFARQRLETSKQ